MTPEQQYDAAMKALDVKVGDLVFIERAIENRFGGWNDNWSSYFECGMSSYLGLVCKVTGIGDDRCGLTIESITNDDLEYSFPPYCMRKATPQEISEYEKG